ncbi:MAG: Gfo/Idh/MocA family oxidoreductase [Lachnospiraceae bacterium]|nr:Gfo/Idh/MocA family oxidoreductase [Lachnospiraceae bacterium]
MKIGIIGCGVISHTYIRDIKRLYNDLEIKAVADSDSSHAETVAKEYGIETVYSTQELLNDEEIQLVVNLTPPALHTEINLMVLNAGKHLFCEKPLALKLSEAKQVVKLAEDKGLTIGCAPDSFMGSSLSTCRKVIEDGWIGKPLYACTNMMTAGVEPWHPRPEPFYKEGGGPVYDMGGYYFTALVTMFGPVRSVRAIGRKGFEKRKIYKGERAGEEFTVDIPTHYSVLAEFESGFIANMNFSFDIFKTEMPMFEVYGTEGTLFVPDPNMHGGTPGIYRKEQMLAENYSGEKLNEDKPYELPELFQNVGEYVRGIGVHDLKEAIENGREPLANGRLALHVLDIMTSVLRSAEEGKDIKLTTGL